MTRLADESGTDDLRAAVHSLHGVPTVHEGRFAHAEALFHDVWNGASTPLDRGAVAGVGMAAVARTVGHRPQVSAGIGAAAPSLRFGVWLSWWRAGCW
ncbi:hypothetical protein AB0D59_12545 [Streptomyces sp. NPDC048417]|uniref:hypothetical protein n=1 Tax=Streptomyces sp. NPDC048417 TaxID=3155387 RepID=UPI00342A42DD